MPENSFGTMGLTLSSSRPTAFQLWKRFFLWIILVIVFSVPFVIFNQKSVYAFDGFVREENNYVIVETKDSGKFVGIKEGDVEPFGDLKINTESTSTPIGSENDKKVIYAFRGIPYAKAPIGLLRWKDPEPIQVTSAPIDTTKYKSTCAQWDQDSERVIGDLDCLYLNIFTPRLHFSISRTAGDGSPISQFDDDPRYAIRLLPVLIWIHTGSFLTGSGNIESPETIIQTGDVILITFNYRLGLFGFLSNGNDVTGNYGLLDQIAVLKWVNKNIHRFGGDPNRVTIAGDTLPLLLVPSVEKYYSGVINLSSNQNPFSPGFASSHSEHSYFRKLVKEVKCGTEPIHDCLALKTADELITLQQKFLHFSIFPRHIKLKLSHLDSSQNNFTLLPQDIEDYFQSEEFLSSKVPILIGINLVQGEEMGLEFLEKYLKIDENMKHSLHNTLKIILPTMLQSGEIFDEIWSFYFGGLDKDSGNYETEFKNQLAKLFGDITVSVPHQKLLEKLSKRPGLVYSFIFESNVPESTFIFSQNVTSIDEEIIGDILRKLWISFTAYKTPKNAVGKQSNWSRFYRLGMDKENKTVNYHISNEGGRMRPGFKEKEAKLWFETLPDLYNSVSHKYETENEDWSLLLWILIGLGILLVAIIGLAILYFVCF